MRGERIPLINMASVEPSSDPGPGPAAGSGPDAGTPPIDPLPADPVPMQHDSDASNAASETKVEKRKVAGSAASHGVDTKLFGNNVTHLFDVGKEYIGEDDTTSKRRR
eukprot:SAG22_NODE_157_length_16986_cov_17.230177_3_plen_108_part_00